MVRSNFWAKYQPFNVAAATSSKYRFEKPFPTKRFWQLEPNQETGIRNSERRFFLRIHALDPHFPWDASLALAPSAVSREHVFDTNFLFDYSTCGEGSGKCFLGLFFGKVFFFWYCKGFLPHTCKPQNEPKFQGCAWYSN